MRIDIKGSVDIKEEISDLIKKKVQKLERFYDHIIDCVVFLSSEGHSKNSNSESIELKLNVKDNTLFCKESTDSFETSIDKAVETMTRQLKKYKEKHQQKS